MRRVGLKEFLVQEFADLETDADIHAQLVAMRCQTHETARDFSYRVRAVAARGVVSERATVGYMAKGLPYDRTVMLEATTFAAIKPKLASYDEAHPTDSKRHESAGPARPVRLGRAEGTAEVVVKRDTKPEIRCYLCGKPGHVARYCQAQPQATGSPRLGQAGPVRRTVTCYMCGQEGDVERVCLKRAGASAGGPNTRPAA